MPSWALFSNTIFVSSTLTTASFTCPVGSLRSSNRACPRFYRSSVSANYSAPNVYSDNLKSPIHYDSLRVLEWDKLCDSVAFFARTSLGREATKAQLWSLNQTYEESMKLLDETNAAVEMHKHGGCSLDFTGINLPLVKSAIRHARRSSPMEGNEAMAISSLLQYADSLHSNLKAAMKEDSDWYTRFMPLSDLIMGFIANQSLVRLIQKVIDEDGTVKDSASSTLKRARDQVRSLEQKLYQLMNSLVRNERKDTSFMEVSSIDGRWCIISVADQPSDFKGLLLSSGSGMGNVIEPLSAVPLNDELQQARASVMKAEGEVLSMLTERMQMDLDDIEKLLEIIVQLDAINARASYGLSYGAAHPDIFQPQVYNSSSLDPSLVKDQVSKGSNTITREWMLYLPKAYHPLLLQQHRENLEKAKKDLKNAIFKMRRKQHGEYMAREGDTDIDLPSLKSRVTALEQAPPVPVDFLISKKTRVLLITGPNTGGKTIGLKTIGLAAMMAKSGLHVLASESVQIPWFDSVFANIGDDQSLSQSLSTFSGHLKQISEIQAASTCQSLVLLDEVGAGTNPLEGAALGMSLLESFAKTGASLTVATTHHGELKSLKYSNDAFENACMEFDEVNLKPTYKILWGVPGRSNAINIAAKLGLPGSIIDSARKLYGAASAEIDEVIIDLENIKRNYGDLLQKSQNHLMHSRVLYKNLLLAQRKITEHRREVRFKKMQEVSEAAIIARSILHKKARQFRTSAIQPLQPLAVSKSHSPPSRVSNTKSIAVEKNKLPKTLDNSTSSVGPIEKSPSEKPEFPKVGDTVYVSSLGRKVSVLSVDSCKEEIVVQAGFMKMKLKLIDLKR